QQQARYELAQTLLAKAELESELDYPEAFTDKAEAQAILGELHAYDSGESLEGASSAPASLSLADRFDAVLDWGRRIGSALSAPVILGEARMAALRLLRAEHCMVLTIVEEGGEQAFLPAAGHIPGRFSEAKIKEALHVRKAMAFLEPAHERAGASAGAGPE